MLWYNLRDYSPIGSWNNDFFLFSSRNLPSYYSFRRSKNWVKFSASVLRSKLHLELSYFIGRHPWVWTTKYCKMGFLGPVFRFFCNLMNIVIFWSNSQTIFIPAPYFFGHVSITISTLNRREKLFFHSLLKKVLRRKYKNWKFQENPKIQYK